MRLRPARPAALLLALVCGACAAIPWPHAPRGEPTPAGAWLDLRGVLHVHTQASHDSPGTIDALVTAARAAGVSWVALTEHTKPGHQGPTGVIDGVNVIPGYELSSAGASLHAIGVAEPPPATKEPGALVRWIHDEGGVAVVGHFEHSRLASPAAYRAAAPDAVELVNLHANAEQVRASLAWRALLLPSALALRPLLFVPEANLRAWQALPGPPPIVGAVDAHAKLRLLGPLGGTPDRYVDVFRLLTTHVLAHAATTPAILEALRAGRSYLAFEGFAAVDSFRFEPTAGGFLLEAPREARLGLVCDGTEVAAAQGRRAVLRPPAGARRCRAEAWLEGRPWILTSFRSLAPMDRP